MESISPSTTGPSTQEVLLPGQLGERFIDAQVELLRAAENALLPYRFQLSPTHQGIQIAGDDVAVVVMSQILERIRDLVSVSPSVDPSALRVAASNVIANNLKRDLAFRLKGLRHPLQPLSLSQVAFMRTLLVPGERLIIGLGPTGTGKTHIAIAAALNQLAEERVKHIVITRPHIVMEGEVQTAASRNELEYDSQFEFFEDILRDLIGYQEFSRLIEGHKLELTPLGHMRGRTFNESFIIVDEAQNMTVRKMRMAATRLGRGSRLVVTGDPAQVDLRGDETSGLSHLLGMIEGTDIATVHRFQNSQIIRNGLVARLEELYSRQPGARPAFAA